MSARRTAPRLAAALLFAATSAFAADAPRLQYSAQHMDRGASPRQDFYRYAVGGWLKRAVIPPSEAEVGGFSQLLANLDAQLLALIRDAAASGAPAGSPRQQVGDFYRAAMDLKRLDALGAKPIEADLKAIEGLDATPAALGALQARLELAYLASPLANLLPMADFKQSDRTLLVLAPGVQALERDEYTQPAAAKLRTAYRDFIARTFVSLGDAPATAAARARTVLALEAELVAARLTPLEMRDPQRTYNVMPFAEAQALVPAIDLAAMARALDVPPPATVQVLDIGAIKALQSVLATRPAEDVRALLRWHVASTRASMLGRPWRDYDAAFTRLRKGLKASPPREREVTQLVSMMLFHPLSRLYVEAHFPDSTRREIAEMVGHVRAEFERRLRDNPWLDEPTRAAALEKLAKVDVQVGYPAQWIDFSGVEIRPDDHLGNGQRVSAMLLRRELAQVGKGVLRDRFAVAGKTTPISVNAAYNPQTNGIDISAAIVQPPFYTPGADTVVNYCTMGAVIGHELTHGFDSFGRQFGPAGNLRDWWTPHAVAEFKKRTDVLVAQYSGYSLLPGLKHNGELTLTENTADLGGITLAHAALARALEGRPQATIDGLGTDQRCFVAWAQMWGFKARPERTRLLAAVDYHGNSTLRGFAPLLHLDAFHAAFGTQPGDRMWRAPAERVRIW